MASVSEIVPDVLNDRQYTTSHPSHSTSAQRFHQCMHLKVGHEHSVHRGKPEFFQSTPPHSEAGRKEGKRPHPQKFDQDCSPSPEAFRRQALGCRSFSSSRRSEVFAYSLEMIAVVKKHNLFLYQTINLGTSFSIVIGLLNAVCLFVKFC